MRFMPLLLLLVIAGMLAFSLSKKPPAPVDHNPMIGHPMTLTLLPMLGSEQQFSPQLWAGKVAVVNIFASWCEPCIAEHPLLMTIATSGKVPIFGIAWKDKPEAVTQWLAQRGNPYQAIGVDLHGQSTLQLALTGVPETFVIARDGTVAYHYNGPLTTDLVNTVILPLISHLQQENVKPR